MVTVISMGGSIVSPPEGIQEDFLTNLKNMVTSYLNEDESRKLIFIIGGGAPARIYQQAYRNIIQDAKDDEADWIGISATRLNAQFFRAIFREFVIEDIVTNPTAIHEFRGRILVAAGWKPGFSTDYDAVILAEQFEAKKIINLSNISKIYSADPKIDPNAVPLDHLSWAEFIKMTGGEWKPGKNTPFDPVATKRAEELKLEVITAKGTELENFLNILKGNDFEGSRIGPN
jgi:uridylate kinase